MTLIDQVIEYETIGLADEVAFFADLIRTGLAWQLQGAYGRTAANYIAAGVISESGEIL